MDDRPIVASYASWEEFQREVVDSGPWQPPTPDDVSRVTLAGPPATRAQIIARVGALIPDTDQAG
ncbi:MAG: hypothetical protein M0T77_01320 [Actinomycetota bacterium]|nr:hypothetical protein [Actinomycetota bacterium]